MEAVEYLNVKPVVTLSGVTVLRPHAISPLTPDPTVQRRSRRPTVPNGGRCQKCNSRMLYHDYDPHHYHNGYTCLMCGTEQVLDNGLKSLIVPRGMG